MATKRLCTIEGCGKPYLARGYCQKHWSRWRAHGDPLKLTMAPQGAPRAFYLSALNSQTDECVLWPYCRDECGYAVLGPPAGSKIPKRVHINLCTALYGPRPSSNHDACHNCGNGHLGCVNPRHLRWDTKKNNCADQLIHGTRRRGEDKWNANLTNAQVLDIRFRVAFRKLTGEMVKDIAASHGVDPRRVTEITKGRSYAHIR